MIRVLQTLALLAGIAFSPSSVVAQPITPAPEDVATNDAAIEKANAGDLAGAIELLEELTTRQDLNVYWLNLGRTYQRAERCSDAVEALTNALSSPVATDPPRSQIRAKATQYLNELVVQCPGRVRVLCEPAGLNVSAAREGDDAPPTAVDCADEIELGGGRWHFTGRLGDAETTQTVEVRAARSYDVELAIQSTATATAVATERTSAEIALDRPTMRPQRKPVAPLVIFSMLGTTSLFAGMVFDGLLFERFPATARNHQLDPMDWVPAGLYLIGTAAIVTALIVWAVR